MSLNRQRTAIETAFFAGFAVEQPLVPVFGENADSSPPSNSAWVRIAINAADITYPCINTDHQQTDGIVSVQVFTPLSIGSQESTQIADSVISVLKQSTLDAIALRDFNVTPAGQESGWYLNVVRATYRAQD